MERYGYKIVTEDMKSLGVKRNPNIMTFAPGEWIVLPENQIKEGESDWGGIWVARTPGKARWYLKYMKETHGKICRIFKAQLGKVLFENDGRIKTDAVFLMEEITDR